MRIPQLDGERGVSPLVMKRFLLLSSVLAAAALVLAPGASARIVELGATANPANPSCPTDPCVAVVRVTGYQGRASGGPKNPYYIRRDGHIVAFTVTLSQPSAEQATFFNDNYGSPAQVQLSVLRKGKTRKTRLQHRLARQTQSEIAEIVMAVGPGRIVVVEYAAHLVRRRIDGEIVLLHRGRLIERASAAEFLNFPKTDAAKAFLNGELLV